MEGVNLQRKAQTSERSFAAPGDRIRLHGNLERDTYGRLQPWYEWGLQQIGNLSEGDLVRESALGLVAVDAVSRDPPFVTVRWADSGPCTAVGRYPTTATLLTRGPAL